MTHCETKKHAPELNLSAPGDPEELSCWGLEWRGALGPSQEMPQLEPGEHVQERRAETGLQTLRCCLQAPFRMQKWALQPHKRPETARAADQRQAAGGPGKQAPRLALVEPQILEETE
jgi:hypothetical protein